MRRHLAFLLGSVAGLVALNCAHAATIPAQSTVLPPAKSYDELLEPVQNAPSLLMADDLTRMNEGGLLLQLVQYHHHHHHHYHHHHHHHHHGFFPGFGISIAPPAYYYGDDCYIRREVHYNRWGYRVIRRVRVCD